MISQELQAKLLNLAQKAQKHWGSYAQKQMLIGEIGELLTLFGRSAQGRDTKQQWVEETADVFIMLFQLANTIGTEEVSECIEHKVNRVTNPNPPTAEIRACKLSGLP